MRYFRLLRHCFFLILGFIFLLPSISDAVRLYSGEERYLLPAGKTIHVSYGNGMFIAVGGYYGSSTILTSSDGIGWTSRLPGADSHLRGSCCGNNVFVAVGHSSTILRFKDGTRWESMDRESLLISDEFECAESSAQ